MKQILAMASVAAMSLSFLTCCGQKADDTALIYGKQEAPSQPSSENVTVSFFGYKADATNLTAIENAIHGFLKENSGIKVEYESIKDSTYFEVLALRLENNNMDDIFLVDHNRVLELAPQRKLADLSDLSTIDGFSEMAKSQFAEKNGSIYFLPTHISTNGMYINLDLLKKNGSFVPENWPEFSKQCDHVKSRGATPVIGNNHSTLRCLMSAQSLYPLYQPDNTAETIEAFNSGEADILTYLEDGIKMARTMLDKGRFDKEELLHTSQASDDLALFAEGERPFPNTGGWASQRLTDMGPKCSYAVYPFPILEDGSVLVMDVNTCVSISAESDCLDDAKKYVEYLTQPDVIFEFCDTQSSYVPLKDDHTPSGKTIVPSAEYLFNGKNNRIGLQAEASA